MNTREAILKAADMIEACPERFKFCTTHIPVADHSCGSPGCALGWIGTFLRAEETNRRMDIGDVADLLINEAPRTSADFPAGNSTDSIFYFRMSRLGGHNWINDPVQCVKGLRAYADEYYPEREPGRSLIAKELERIFKTVAPV